MRQYVEDRIVKVIFVRSAENEVDTFTKKMFKKHATKNLASVDRK